MEANETHSTWEELKNQIKNGFVRTNYVHPAQNRLVSIRQRRSIADYLDQFRNFVVTISRRADGEKLQRFAEGLKGDVQTDVVKGAVSAFNDAVNYEFALTMHCTHERNDTVVASPPAHGLGRTDLEIYRNTEPVP